MGVTQLGKIIETSPITFEALKNKTVAIDAYNSLYQFLATIRQATDGSPLTDEQGRITSHLLGLFNRTIRLVEMGIKPIYVFDGPPIDLKKETLKKRSSRRSNAKELYEKAIKEGDYSAAKKYAQAAIFLDSDMVKESKKLLSLLGVPIVNAPAEGEAQAAYMSLHEKVWASSSQDWDSILFGSTRLIRNLTISGTRRTASGVIKIDPEVIELETVIKTLKITREQLIDIGILVGNDYNEGIKGIGPKNAFKYIEQYQNIDNFLEKYEPDLETKKEKAYQEKEDLEKAAKSISDEIKLSKNQKDLEKIQRRIEDYELNLQERIPIIREYAERIRAIFLNPEINKDFEIKIGFLRKKQVYRFLLEKNFNQDKLKRSLKRLEKYIVPVERKTIDSYF